MLVGAKTSSSSSLELSSLLEFNSASFERVDGLVDLIGPSSRADAVEIMGGEIFEETIGEVVEKTSVFWSDDIYCFSFLMTSGLEKPQIFMKGFLNFLAFEIEVIIKYGIDTEFLRL